MAGVNQVTILGNLGADPDVKKLANNEIMATLSVATSRSWKVDILPALKDGDSY